MNILKKDSENSKDILKISEGSAERILDEYLDYFDLSLKSLLEENENSEDLQNSIRQAYNRLVSAIQKGKIEINMSDDTCLLIQHIGKGENSKTIEYKELSGAAKVAMKNAGADDLYGKIYSLVGSLTGVGKEGITKLKGRDLSLAESIGMLIMQI